jgi:hypothetical protein
MHAFKLFKLRKDGTLGPLFINARQRIPVGEWLEAGDHPTHEGLRPSPGLALHPAAGSPAPQREPEGRTPPGLVPGRSRRRPDL